MTRRHPNDVNDDLREPTNLGGVTDRSGEYLITSVFHKLPFNDPHRYVTTHVVTDATGNVTPRKAFRQHVERLWREMQIDGRTFGQWRDAIKYVHDDEGYQLLDSGDHCTHAIVPMPM